MSGNKKSRFSPFLKQCFVTAAVGNNIIGHGCMLGYTAILLPQLKQEDSSIKLDVEAASWIASIIGITHLLGSFLTPPVMEKYGRKIAHYAVIVPNLLSWIIIALSVNFEMLFAARILQGLSIGMLSPLRSVLIGEYTSPKNRGAFLTTVSLTQSLGILFVHLAGSLLSWQMTALICVVFPFTSLVMTIYSPESPSWLVTRGRLEDCREVFHWLRGDDENEELEEMIQTRMLFERARISRKYEHETNQFQDLLSTVHKREFYRPILLMMHAHVLVNFAGGATMSSYSTVIIATVMGPEASPYFWMIFLDAQRFVSNTLAIFAINRFKRRTMMFSTGALSVLSQVALAVYLYVKEQGNLAYDGLWIPILLINLKILAVGIGMLPLPNVIGGEVFPLEYRSIGGMLSLATFSATYFVVLKTFTGLVESIGMYGVYLIYAGVITYCMVVIWLLLPETKGKTLQQIEDEFRGKPLAPEEIEARKSLQEDPIAAYKRKMSVKSVNSIHVEA
ncbi:facilitated trehalose transporter Tret1-like [Anticarsia gemmatalis]|uniref:facilitated trehalose transporter Tret1-like n=1 Tax=Anticarsia gemmatalis TaxID=129554 RepID=UPI003F7584DB